MRFSRYPWWRRWFGARSERFAARHLRREGFRILARNYSDRAGEIDLLALDGQTLVIVEVRSTGRDDPASVLASVDAAKQRRLSDAALRFLQARRLLGKIGVRFDVIAVAWPEDAPAPRLLHLRNAFPAVGRHQLHA